MLNEGAHGNRQAQRPLRQEYEEFLLQRIEEFKEQLARDELMEIADEAVKARIAERYSPGSREQE